MGDFLGSIFDFLGGTVVGAIESFLIWLYQLIVVVFQVLYQLIVLAFNFLWKIAQAVAGFFKHLWDGFFKSIFTKVWDVIRKAQAWIEARLRPLIEFLKRVRKYLQVYYNTYLRPLLVMIQRIRQYLQILSLLHISIAQKLDAYLAQLQAKIVQSFAVVSGAVNALIDITNALVDPRYLLKKPALLLSIRRQIPALIHAVTGRPPGYWFPSPRGAGGGVFKPPTTFPFNFADPAQNPATSQLLGDDGLGALDPYLLGFEFADGAVDAARPLDYFDDDLYPVNKCSAGDPSKCLLYSWGASA